MRKTILMGLGLALCLAGAAAAQQQQDTPRRPNAERERGDKDSDGRFEGRGRGPEGFLLKDITLTAAQKTQVKQLREAEHAKMDANRELMKKQHDEARAARQRGDTAAVKAIMQRNRDAMERDRGQHIAAVRNILTAEQRVQFDKNVAALKQREQERSQRVGQRGPRGEHGFRGGKGRPGKG